MDPANNDAAPGAEPRNDGADRVAAAAWPQPTASAFRTGATSVAIQDGRARDRMHDG